MTEDSINTAEEKTNTNLYAQELTKEALKTYLRLKYANYREAGRGAGISAGRVRQILIGYDCPKSASMIRQIAKGWGVDEIKLTILFLRLNDEQKEKERGIR